MEVSKIGDYAPQNIVIIIGESLAKSHCSLYGYEHCTQPYLEKMRDDSLIYSLNVSSSGISTMASFMEFIGTWHKGDEKKWYDAPNIFDLGRTVGYKTFWLSNQNHMSITDSPISNIAKAADYTEWASGYAEGSNLWGFPTHDMYDSELFPLIDRIIAKEGQTKNIYIIHVIGQHSDYSKRFPKYFGKFTAKDYPERKENQRNLIAVYDNSVLYNDSIVAEIFNRFSGQETIGFYFSDHGQDLYDTHDDYCGHSILSDPVSCKLGLEIPFLIYISPTMKKNFPDISRNIAKLNNSASDGEYETTNFIYTLANVLGYEIEDGKDVKFLRLR